MELKLKTKLHAYSKVNNLNYTSNKILDIDFSIEDTQENIQGILMANINVYPDTEEIDLKEYVREGIYRGVFGPSDYRDVIITPDHTYYIDGYQATVNNVEIIESIPTEYLH